MNRSEAESQFLRSGLKYTITHIAGSHTGVFCGVHFGEACKKNGGVYLVLQVDEDDMHCVWTGNIIAVEEVCCQQNGTT